VSPPPLPSATIGARQAPPARRGTIAQVTSRSAAAQHLDGTFAKLEASSAEVVQEPTEQPYGVRDCAFRERAGNMIRIQELR
jgi:uncharacterized glyoxalase superfamily protein PhnB